jgi:hypothetical protein
MKKWKNPLKIILKDKYSNSQDLILKKMAQDKLLLKEK